MTPFDDMPKWQIMSEFALDRSAVHGVWLHAWGDARKFKKGRMARVSKQEQDKWEQILQDCGLSMDAGRDPGHRKLIHIGSTNDLERFHAAKLVKQAGKVEPSGAPPDK